MNAARLHLGLVGPLPPPAGGMANQTRQLAELLRNEGATVELIQVNRAYRPACIGRVKVIRALWRLVPYLLHLWQAAGRVQVLHVMANSGWSWHLFAAPAVWIGVLRRVPVIVNYRGGNADDFFAQSYFWVRPTLKICNQIVVPSKFLQSVFERRGISAKVIPNIVNLSRFSQLDLKPLAAPHIIVTRNLEPLYDIPTALKAFAMLRREFPSARISIAGSGPQQAALKDQATELGVEDAVCFTGRLHPEQMARLYRSADVMLNPSRIDNMPNSILEALASGVPVVSTDVGGIPYLVDDGKTALLVPPGDAQTMAASIIRLLKDRALAAELVQAGLQLVRRYDWPAVREQWLAAYRLAGSTAGLCTLEAKG